MTIDNGDHNDDDNGDDYDDNGDDNGDEHAEFVALVQVAGRPSPLVFHRSEKGGGRTLGGNFRPGAVTLDFTPNSFSKKRIVTGVKWGHVSPKWNMDKVKLE